jgi:hypothetical protein
VTPTDYAAEEIALWEEALREQRLVEEQISAARSKRQMTNVLEPGSKLRVLRTTADLLLADAVKVKRTFRDPWPDSVPSTTGGALHEPGARQ